jgi:hypothetical protein
VQFDGFGPEYDGLYRRVDATFLGWMDFRLRMAEIKGVGHEEWSRAVIFYHELLQATGIRASEGFPPDYRKPEPIRYPEGLCEKPLAGT